MINNYIEIIKGLTNVSIPYMYDEGLTVLEIQQNILNAISELQNQESSVYEEIINALTVVDETLTKHNDDIVKINEAITSINNTLDNFFTSPEFTSNLEAAIVEYLNSSETTTLINNLIRDILSSDYYTKVDIDNKFTNFIATTSTVGGVKVGKNLTITEDGVLDAVGGEAPVYELPVATSSVLGGVKIGDNLNIENGVLSTHPEYNLPTATSSVIGGVKVGNSLNIIDGVLNVNYESLDSRYLTYKTNAKSLWVGTQAEYDIAIANGVITSDTLAIIKV